MIRSSARRRLVGFVLVRVAADEAEILTIAVRASQSRPRHRAPAHGRRAPPPLSRARIKSLLSRGRPRQRAGGRRSIARSDSRSSASARATIAAAEGPRRHRACHACATPLSAVRSAGAGNEAQWPSQATDQPRGSLPRQGHAHDRAAPRHRPRARGGDRPSRRRGTLSPRRRRRSAHLDRHRLPHGASCSRMPASSPATISAPAGAATRRCRRSITTT